MAVIQFAPLFRDIGRNISESEFGIDQGTLVNTSPWTGDRQVALTQRTLWKARIKTTILKDKDAGMWKGFLTSCQGKFNTFLIADPDMPKPLGGVNLDTANTLTVTADANPGAKIFNAQFASQPVTEENLFEIGDYIQVGSLGAAKLYMITEAVGPATVANPTVSIKISPPLKRELDENTVVTFQKCYTNFALDDDVINWKSNKEGLHQFEFSATEAF